ncbi:hypothetical protein HOF78_01890 [Candidatus Woesearchaeota archaeon]|nr:hypothetical protein [Candidatus Woesearchaeota archaeon]
MTRNKLSMNYPKFLHMLRVVEKAVHEGRGFFQGDWRRRFLPQWNLPSSLEYEPRRKEVAKPEAAARWIFTRVALDRLSLSTQLGEYAINAWEDDSTRWLFNPGEVVDRSIGEVEDALKDCFNHALPVTPGMSGGEGYRNNAGALIGQYGGDVRNVISGISVAQGINRLKKFDGWGPGLSRLLMMELHDRRIVSPINPGDLENKIDRHKAAIPLNTECVTASSENVHMSSISKFLQESYRLAFESLELPPEDVDAAIWVIGSKGCVKQRIYHCNSHCPLSPIASGLCVRASSLGHSSGSFSLIKNGDIVDSRRPNSQIPLDFTGIQGLEYEV